jgi:hypothetical protein
LVVSKRICLSAAAVAAFVGLTALPASAEKICQPRLESGATHGAIRASVEARAIVLWSADVTDRHALRYANWNNATARNVSCRRYTSAIGVNLWECRASANPCRLR